MQHACSQCRKAVQDLLKKEGSSPLHPWDASVIIKSSSSRQRHAMLGVLVHFHNPRMLFPSPGRRGFGNTQLDLITLPATNAEKPGFFEKGLWRGRRRQK